MRDIKHLWKQVDCICLDFDSTMCTTESIDDLADFMGKSNEIKSITKKGMEGNIKFEDSLAQRLKILSLDLKTYHAFLECNSITLTKNIDDFIKYFRSKGIPIYIISGGFDDLIQSIVKPLDFAADQIYANRLIFNSKGEYEDFDRTKFTSHSGGKAEVIKHIRTLNDYNNIFVIGDGITDLEACPPADGFIAFTGNITRDIIVQKAEWHVNNFLELIETYAQH